MTTQALNLYEILKSTLNENGAKAVVGYLDERMDINTIKYVDMRIEHLATREDLTRVEARLETKIAEGTANLMKWMFLFIMGQTALLIGVTKLFL